MPNIGDILQWITENESLLSGLAAMIVLAGVILSPLGMGLRRLFARKRQTQPDALPEPIPATARLTSKDRTAPSLHAAKVAAPTEPLLVVLAFDNLSNDPEMQFFSDGVSEDIIQRLSRGAKLKVIGRTSSFQFRGERKAEAAQSLDCTHVLDGSIRRAGGARADHCASGRVGLTDHFVVGSVRPRPGGHLRRPG